MVADEPVVPKSPMLNTMVSVMAVDSDVKVEQDKEPREPEIPPPKRIRNPRVEVCVIRRRRVISYHGRTLIGIIVVYNGVVCIVFAGGIVRSST